MRVALTLVCSIAVALGACEQRSNSGGIRYYGRTKPRHPAGEIWTNLNSEPEWIDPGKCSENNGSTVITNLFAGLTQPHPMTLRPMPDLAHTWEVSPDGRTYTFHLRPSSWSDGVPLTAHDFEYSWKRALARETASRYASFLFPLKNAEAFNQGKLPGSSVGVRALDDLTLRVELDDPLPYFLYLTNYPTMLPVPRHVIERLAKRGLNTDLWTRPEWIVSNGPFTLSGWTFRRSMTLSKNPLYWDRESVKPTTVRLVMVDSSNTVLNLYQTADLDYIGPNTGLPSEFIDHLKTFGDFRRNAELAVYFFWFNVSAPPVDDARVRRALSLAVDRDSLVKYVSRGGQAPTADLVPDGLAGYRGLRSPTFDPEAARKLLAEAGYGPQRPLPAITLRYNTAEQHKQLAEAMQQMWKKHLGVDVQIENQEWKVYLKSLQAKEFQIARFGWIGDYPDPYTFLELLAGNNGNNNSNWSDPRYDRLLRQANASVDRDVRLSLLREAERLAMQAAPLLPVYVYMRSELVKPYLMGLFSNLQKRTMMKYWWIDERWYDGVPVRRLADEPPPWTPPAVAPRSALQGVAP
jgi:ABC-type oligopeptide transport system substrate-binding subunit